MPILEGVKTPLFRAACKSAYAQAFAQGRIRLGSLCYYRDIEDATRRDASEGFGHFIDEDGQQWHVEFGGAIYIMSLALPQVDVSVLKNKFGQHLLRVHDAAALARDVESSLLAQGFKTFGPVRGRPVEYSKGRPAQVPSEPIDRAVLSVIQKSAAFTDESEYRLFVILNRPPNQNNEKVLELNIGKPLPYAEVVPS